MRKLAVIGAMVVFVGCSSDPAPETTTQDTGTAAADTASEDTSSSMLDTGNSTADTAVSETAAAKPATPEITNLMPMAGAWHVTWKTNDTGLSKVELWRSNDGAAATLVKSFGGTAKDWHDAAAPGTTVKYCYTVKTFRGDLASDASPEKCTK